MPYIEHLGKSCLKKLCVFLCLPLNRGHQKKGRHEVEVLEVSNFDAGWSLSH